MYVWMFESVMKICFNLFLVDVGLKDASVNLVE